MMKRRWLFFILMGFLMALLFTGCAANSGGSTPAGGGAVPPPVQKPVDPTKPVQVKTVPVKVYYGTHDAQHVVAEVHMFNNDSQLMLRAMETLTAGPKSSDLVSVVPKATKVKSVVVRDKIAFVDFSAEIAKRGFGGSATEILAVGAIVNTLTEFPGVEQVQILVEGKKVDTLYGHLDVYDPMSRSPAIIKNK